MTEGSSMLSAEVVIRPEFHDLDPMQIVWHGNYMRYFETARTALLGLIDYDYPQMVASGYAWPVVDFRIKYSPNTTTASASTTASTTSKPAIA
jgi:acyl-CoA thioester hydrolase